jgi:hypothetical protein
MIFENEKIYIVYLIEIISNNFNKVYSRLIFISRLNFDRAFHLFLVIYILYIHSI